MVALPGTSVIVSVERSRTVTTALPPSSMRAIALSPVVTLSLTKTSSLNFSGCGASVPRVTVTLPSSVVTTAALAAWATATEGQRMMTEISTAAGRTNLSMTALRNRTAGRGAGTANKTVTLLTSNRPASIELSEICGVGRMTPYRAGGDDGRTTR